MFITGVLYPHDADSRELHAYNFIQKIDIASHIDAMQNMPIVVEFNKDYPVGRVIHAYIDDLGNVCIVGKITNMHDLTQYACLQIGYSYMPEDNIIRDFVCSLGKETNTLYKGCAWTNVNKKVQLSQRRF